METYEATTVENDENGFEDLKEQMISARQNLQKPESEEKPSNKKTMRETSQRKNVFKKGEQTFELDDDYELEFMADKRPVRLKLKDLKERAAGEIAVKNRMHSLAEEKKRVQSTFTEFARLAKEDPLGALEYISGKAKESDSEFEYMSYLEKLGEQAEKIGRMDEKDRKAWELEKKLTKAEENLSQKERQQAVVQRKQELLETYTGIGDSEFSQMVDAVLESEELLEGLETEQDVMDKVEELIQETLTQRDIITVIQEINPDYASDTSLIFSLSDQLRQNPDLDEEDVRDIISQLVGPKPKAQNTERDRDIRSLSRKQRQGMTTQQLRQKEHDPYESLKQQLLDNKEKISRTPIQLR